MQTQGSAARIGGQGFSLRFISGETFIHHLAAMMNSLRCVAHELECFDDVTSTPARQSGRCARGRGIAMRRLKTAMASAAMVVPGDEAECEDVAWAPPPPADFGLGLLSLGTFAFDAEALEGSSEDHSHAAEHAEERAHTPSADPDGDETQTGTVDLPFMEMINQLSATSKNKKSGGNNEGEESDQGQAEMAESWLSTRNPVRKRGAEHTECTRSLLATCDAHAHMRAGPVPRATRAPPDVH